MKSHWLVLPALLVSQFCAAGYTDGECTPETVTDWWTEYVNCTLPPLTTTITIIPSCDVCPTFPASATITLTSTLTLSSRATPVTSTITIFTGGGTTTLQTDIIISGGSIATTYTTTISGVRTVVSTYVSELHDFNGTVVTVESTKPGNHVSTGGIVGIGIGVFSLGALLAACLLPFCIRRRPKKPEGYAAPPAQGGYGT
jgi:hypothetical protein